MSPRKAIETLEVRSRAGWREWLSEHHDSISEIWLVFHKRHTGRPSLGYDDAVEEASCFRWIDSLVRRLDDDRHARKFTPRKADSRWSSANRRRYAELEACGLLAPPGRKRAPTERSGDSPRPAPSEIPAYIEPALRADPGARRHFAQLAPSYRRAYIGWMIRPKAKRRRRGGWRKRSDCWRPERG